MKTAHDSRLSLAAILLLVVTAACRFGGGGDDEAEEFRTSGDPTADRRADQRVTEIERAREDGGAVEADDGSLWMRLGQEQGVLAIVEDFVARVIADPRANWQRAGVERSRALGLGTTAAVRWEATPENVARLRTHLAEFIAVASGGPPRYRGATIREAHQGMLVTNSEFDATIGALKATLDSLGVDTAEQRELLAIFESTRPQIVEER